ncbi:thiolase family protein [Nocardia jiangxiensis]|uniref:Thiolase family protein n=1 Tax=Nocardia jiangxiensis TaxID=282685 RepID=A0ABW6SEA0_9NOCA|nr:thiolase family protein [Nocardia jiangxiensis]
MSRFINDVAVVGVGQSNFRELYSNKDTSRDLYGLAAGAFREALDDAGIEKSEVDGLLCTNVKYGRMADVLGMHNVRFVHDLEGSGRMSGVVLQEACALVRAGLADVVACVYATNGRSARLTYGGEEAGPTASYDTMYGMTSPGAYVAMMYQRYRQLYGASEDALAALAINNRRNAALNPAAVFQQEIDRDDYMASRFVSEPLRKLDYCLINDGGVAFIVTSLERARSMRKPPVRVIGTAGMSNLTNFYTSEDFFYSACSEVASRLYKETGLKPDHVDCLQVYDNFTPTILFTLEGFGHAPKGGSWEWVQDGRIHRDGPRPLNTSGGHTSESYMQGFALHVEAVRQARGEAGERQVANCETVQYMCASPIVTSHVLTVEK